MKKKLIILLVLFAYNWSYSQLVITGIADGPLSGGTPKVIELYAYEAIPDLSIYGIESANNGSASVAPEEVLANSANKGQFIYIASEGSNFNAFFGFDPDMTSSVANNNGDDAIVLYKNGVIVDVFGEVGTDGTDTEWENLDGWAYRVSGTGPDGANFVITNWTFSGINQLEGGTTNATTKSPFPVGTYKAKQDNAEEISTPTFNPVSGSYATAQNVSISSLTPEVSIYYTTDGSIPSKTSMLYETPLIIKETTTIKAIAYKGGDSSSVATAAYSIEVATPIITPEITEFSDSVVVSISSDTPGAVIYYTTDGSAPDSLATLYMNSFTLKESATIKAIAYSGDIKSGFTEKQYVIIEVAAPIEVNTLSELRAGETDGTIYHYNGEAILTYSMNFRNQKYIQDETGAILIDDDAGIITTSFQIDEGISDLTGTLYDYNGLLEFIPTKDAASINSTLTIEPQNISISELNSNFEDYESELIHFAKIKLSSPSVFEAGTNYTISDDNAESSILRTHFYDADYIGSDMINGSFSVTGIALWNAGEAKIVPRMASDMEKLSSTNDLASDVQIYSYGSNIQIKKYAYKSIAEVYSYDGRKIRTIDANDTHITIEMKSSGLYLVLLKVNNQVHKMKKVIIM